MKIKVYAGLSLAADEVRGVLPDCEVAAPVQRGDVLADISAATNVIVIIDGKFQQSLAVSTAEIMDALRCGVRIYGASSMGALRAAELHPYGMTGQGAIFEMVCSRSWFRDDLLGQVFFESSLESASVPYVNVHFGLGELQAQGVISRAEQALLDELCKEIHFSQRNRATLAQAIEARDPPRKDALIAAVSQALAHNQKKLDALDLLQRVQSDLQRTAELNRQLLSSQRESVYHDQLDPAVEMSVGILLGP